MSIMAHHQQDTLVGKLSKDEIKHAVPCWTFSRMLKLLSWNDSQHDRSPT